MKKLFHKIFGKPVYVVYKWSSGKDYLKKGRIFHINNERFIIKFHDGEMIEATADGKLLNQPDYKEWFPI